MVAYSNCSHLSVQPDTAEFCPAKALGPELRQDLALEVLAGTESVTRLAQQHEVSRKFLYRQAAKAEEALQEAFASDEDEGGNEDGRVLFSLPVTKAWIEQLVLGLTLECHSSLRGVVELLRDLFDYPLSVGTVHNILQRVVSRARTCNEREDLSAVRVGAHDEIFQAGRPVLVGVDVDSTYCYLLRQEAHHDADSWGVHLLDLQKQGFAPEATVADFGRGLRAGQALAMPEVPCRGDVFHAEHALLPLATYLENRAYEALAHRDKIARKKAKTRRRGKRTTSFGRQLSCAEKALQQAVALAEDVATLADWLRRDILALAGPDHAARAELFDFVVAELKALEPQCPHRIAPVARLLANHRDELLAFAAQLDRDLAALATEFQLPPETIRAAFNLETLSLDDPARWPRETALRRQLGGRFFAVAEAVAEVVRRTVRASSVVENLNGRLRTYFFLRRSLGAEYLALLQFFLNHRRFLRSEHPERVGKSPAELLADNAHPHWLEMLGYRRFSRN
jgi:hypothetical protein